ncbi:hypothetical protein A2U01_0059363, partial [Trifolium medium]|nr:hypothetical protein [Trifolium medium]
MPQTRNFFDHDNFESPGTHRFNENFTNVYYLGESIQPQPTQQIPQDYTWAHASDDFLNSTWAHGQGSTSAPGQGASPITQAINFLGVDETQEINPNHDNEHVELLGRGHRRGYPPNCG